MKTISSSECSRISSITLLHPLLEVAAVAGAGDQPGQVELDDPLALERARHVAVDDALGDALDDRGLADAGLADEHRVVLGAPRQHLDGLLDLVARGRSPGRARRPAPSRSGRRRTGRGSGCWSRRVAATGATLAAARALTTGRGGALQRLRGDALGAEQRGRRRLSLLAASASSDVLGADVGGAQRAGDLVRVEQRALGGRGQRRRLGAWPRRAAAARRRCGPGPRGRRRRRTAAGAAAGTWVTTSSRCHGVEVGVAPLGGLLRGRADELAGRLGHELGDVDALDASGDDPPRKRARKSSNGPDPAPPGPKALVMKLLSGGPRRLGCRHFPCSAIAGIDSFLSRVDSCHTEGERTRLKPGATRVTASTRVGRAPWPP